MSSAKAWQMVVVAGLAQNAGVVTSVVAYGTALGTIQDDLEASRAMASLATSFQLLVLGLISPYVGNLLQRIRLRTVMTVGAVLSCAGHLVVAIAPNIYVLIGAYAALIGPGACLLGPVPVATLVSRWFDTGRGKALAVANVPIFLFFVPPVAAWLIELGGRELLFSCLAGLFILLLPIIWLIVERPDRTPESVQPEGVAAAPPRKAWTNVQLLRDWRFWALSLGIGILTGSGVAYTTHGVQIVVGKGIDLTLAASVLSAYGFGTVLGVVLFGWLVDRIGSLPSVILGATVLAGCWGAFAVFVELSALLMVSTAFGAVMGSVVAMHGAAINELFGEPSVSRGMGLGYFLKIPFMFGFPYLLGKLYDVHQNYVLALLVTSLLVLAAIGSFFLVAFATRINRLKFGQSKGPP